MSLIQVTLPNPSNIAKGVAISTIIGKTFPNGKPLPVVLEKSNLKGNNDYLGVPALTELGIRYNGQEYFFNDCVLTVNQPTIIKTEIIEGREGGSVKEYICEGDFEINAEIGIGGDYLLSTKQEYQTSDAYPLTEIKQFISIIRAKMALEVTSDWLDMFGIKSVVVINKNATQQTHSNRQYFTLQLLSDNPYEITLLQDA